MKRRKHSPPANEGITYASFLNNFKICFVGSITTTHMQWVITGHHIHLYNLVDEKCWAHSPLRAAARRCPQQQRQRVTEGTAMAP